MDLFPKRSYKLTKEAAAALQEQKELFRKKFGRDPGPGDPLFFDPDAQTPRPLQLEPMEHHMIETMKKAGIRPEIIYAVEKTGRLVTEGNMKNLTQEELDEWQAAIDEYREKHSS